jgi:hypothetical protein
MSIEHTVKVKITNPNVSANLKLIGFPSSEETMSREAIITLGGIEVLRTPNDYLERDIERIQAEIENKTLLIDYQWNESLIPFIEMLGERNQTIKKLRASLNHKGYSMKNKTPIVSFGESTIHYAVAKKGDEVVDIGRRDFDNLDSEYFVQVLSGEKPSDALFKRLNHAGIVEAPNSCNWGDKVDGIPDTFSYRIEYSMLTRTEPAEVSKSLSKTASALVSILNKNS